MSQYHCSCCCQLLGNGSERGVFKIGYLIGRIAANQGIVHSQLVLLNLIGCCLQMDSLFWIVLECNLMLLYNLHCFYKILLYIICFFVLRSLNHCIRLGIKAFLFYCAFTHGPSHLCVALKRSTIWMHAPALHLIGMSSHKHRVDIFT